MSNDILNEVREFLRERGPNASDTDLAVRQHDRAVRLLMDLLAEHSRLIDEAQSEARERFDAVELLTKAGVPPHQGLNLAVLSIVQMLEAARAPIPMRLHCPGRLDDGSVCGVLHIDEGEFATRSHKVHACQSCGEHFQPALVPTVGVRWLPGCKNEEDT